MQRNKKILSESSNTKCIHCGCTIIAQSLISQGYIEFICETGHIYSCNRALEEHFR